MSIEKKIRKYVRDEISNCLDSPLSSAINFLKKQIKKSENLKKETNNLKKEAKKQGIKVSNTVAQAEKKHSFLYRESIDLLKGTIYGGIGYAVGALFEEDSKSQQKEQVKRLEKAAKDLEKSNREAAQLISKAQSNLN